jgi:phospholipase/carboxylesterase
MQRLDVFSRGSLLCLLAPALASASIGCAGSPVEAQTPVGVSTGPEAAAGAPIKNADGSLTLGSLRYLEVLTGGAAEGEPLPLVVGIHGHGQSPKMFERAFSSYAGKARFVMPFGPTQAGERGFEWMPGGISNPRHHAELAAAMPGVAARISAWINDVERARPTVGKPVVTGFSQGASLTYGLALLHPDQFSMMCPMAGHIPPDLFNGAAASPQRPEVHGVHGDADPAVSLADGQRTIDSLQRLGYVADLKVEPGVVHQFGPGSADVMACIARGIAGATAAR